MATNPYINRVDIVRGGTTETLINLTGDTITPADLAQGVTAHDASGAAIVGTMTGGGGSGGVTQDANGYLVLSEEGGDTPTPSGGGSMSDPIRFFDYDGTLVASYTAVPDSLPSVPTHDKLTNGTWNYTLAQVTTQYNAMGTCDVGANYDTVSGATEIDIELHDGRLHPYLSLAVNGTVSIDWGDGSTPDTSTGTSLTTRKSDIHHEYVAAGKYTIKITKTSGTGYSLYCSGTYTLLNKNSSGSNVNRVYANAVKSVRVGDDYTIGNYAFSYCCSLTSVSIPSSVTNIADNAFNYCNSLAFASIPTSITSIGTGVFNYCCSLTSVSIPSSVTNIGNTAFSSCYSLASVSIPSGVTSIGNSAFGACYSLASVSIPSGATSIGYSAFSNCYSLESVSIPNSITSIGYGAFNYCSSLATIELPSGLTTISGNKGTSTTGCFQNCNSLASITIPSGVTEITANDFSNCYGMAEYHFTRTESVPTLANTNAFSNIQSDCKIYVPSSKLTDYQTATNWSTYASYMVGE